MGANVVLIAGFPHGGTTITNIVVGQHPAVFAAGELKGFPDGGQFKPANDCSCGAPAQECEFWREVRSKFEQAASANESSREVLYDLVSRMSGRPVVIDVAHDVERVEELVGEAKLNLKLLHVVRDGAAVVHSRIRLDYKEGYLSGLGLKHIRRSARTALRWRQFVKRLSAIEAGLGADALRISYEQLCFEPKSVIESVGHFLDLDYRGIAEQIASDGRLQFPPHMIRGNGTLRKSKEIMLRHDDRYRREMHMVDRLISRALSSHYVPAV